jgi:putative oxygen-independent coproporphyrinogen III oxidase
MMVEDWRNGGFGLYIHWPFCQSKCPYCDFNSHVAASIDQNRWKSAYLREIERVGIETQGRILDSVFFGGGTPSLMQPDVVAAVVDAIRRTWACRNDLEITLEANPGSVERTRFQGFREAGVNRLSMGLQALNDRDLRALGRLHSVEDALRAFDVARTTFERVSFDLIYARQAQTLDEWRKELSLALSLSVDHLSMYQLTIEEGTAFADRFAAGRLKDLPDEGLAADMYDLTQDLCEAAGMAAYEVSNHAKEGAESRHNLIYWRGGDYIGIGPGAHGRLTFEDQRVATEAIKTPGGWLSGVETGQPVEQRDRLTPEERAIEYILMGLRLSEGIDLTRLQAVSGLEPPQPAINELIYLGMLSQNGPGITATPNGRLVLNSVIKALVNAL